MAGDGVQCEDIDECAVNTHGCSQLCVNTDGSYTCACLEGYETALTDNKACIGEIALLL